METDACEPSVHIDDLKNEVVVVSDAGVIVKELRPLPGLTDFDALIRVEAVALCGSDIHVFETGAQSCQNITLGHDATGIVESVGQHVQLIKRGDRVVMESALSCGICSFCKSGAYNMCPKMVFNGFLSKYQVHPADLCFKLPNNVSSIEGTLTNTLAMGCQTCLKANVTPLTNLLIIGSNATALSAAFCAKKMGTKNICLTCNMKDSLSMIKRTFGFDFVHYDQSTPLAQILENIHEELQNWPDVAINCAISEWTMNMAVMVLQPSGTCILAECDTECCSFNAMDVLMKNLKIIPSFRHTNMFPMAICLMGKRKVPMAKLVSESFSWKDVADAFRAAQHEANIGHKKVIVKCSDIPDCFADKT